MRTTPFHERIAPLNRTYLWEHWAGFVTAVAYQHSVATEYFATRNSVAVFDTSPLFKYRIAGPDATAFLAGVFARDIRRCAIGEGHYTVWCNDEGYLLEDGVVLRLGEDEYLATSAEPNLRHFRSLANGHEVTVEDLSDAYGILAVQGPHSVEVIRRISPEAGSLPYFGVTRTSIANHQVVVSRTGFTADLGYEIWIETADALPVWDTLMDAGADYNLIPMGMRALGMARLDGGMLLINADFEPARHAWTDAQRETPDELGLAWMVNLADDRPFVGRRAIEAERANGTSRWKTVGFHVDAAAYEAIYNNDGLAAPKEGVYEETAHSLYDRDFNVDAGAQWVGYATSFGFSPILKRHIGLAKLPLDRCTPGLTAHLELVVNHRPKYVPVEVSKTPFWNPARKTNKEQA
ncbi:MAG: aminomethyl transferase family protein [Acidimicrobiia bacterium]|nr:aminomethyl transferase family protein [Acidimicrobiia bacterium]